MGTGKFLGVLAGVLLVSTVASAKSWEQSFESERVGSYVQGTELRFVVVPANHSAMDAAKAVADAMRGLMQVKLVMDASALGSVRGLSDEQIVKKCGGLPVDRVAVVRVFDGLNPSAVVTLYRTDGETVGAMNATLGEPLAANRRKASGISAETSSVANNVLGGSKKKLSSAEEQYERKALWLKDMVGVQANAYGAWTTTWQEPRLGKYGEIVSWSKFFTMVGRKDLSKEVQAAEDAEGRKTFGKALFWTGLTVGITGGTLWVLGNASAEDTYDDEYYNDEDEIVTVPAWMKLATVAGFGTGLLGWILEKSAPKYPDVESHEVREMVDNYNKDLKKDLGIAQRKIPSRVDVGIAPTAGGLGLLLNGTF